MKVLIVNPTGSQKLEALLDKDSGVIEFANGEISHVLHEKNMYKTIFVVKDEPKPKPVEKAETLIEQSAPIAEKPNKRKSSK